MFRQLVLLTRKSKPFKPLCYNWRTCPESDQHLGAVGRVGAGLFMLAIEKTAQSGMNMMATSLANGMMVKTVSVVEMP